MPSSNSYIARVNNYHDKINNPVTRTLYSLLLQLPANIISKAFEVITEPFNIYAEHILKNQKLGIHADGNVGTLEPNSRLKVLRNALASFKHRLALIAKLPVDLFTGFIKTMLFFPMFIFKAPYDLLTNCKQFLSKYTTDETNLAVRSLAEFAKAVLTVPHMPLRLVNNVLRDGIFPATPGKEYTNISVGGMLDALERGVNYIVHSATWLATEILFSPVTAGLYVADKAVNAFTAVKADRASAAVKINGEVEEFKTENEESVEDVAIASVATNVTNQQPIEDDEQILLGQDQSSKPVFMETEPSRSPPLLYKSSKPYSLTEFEDSSDEQDSLAELAAVAEEEPELDTRPRTISSPKYASL